MTTRKTITSEELWEEVDRWQCHLENAQSPHWDRMFSAETLASTRQRLAEMVAESLATICVLFRCREDW